MKKPKGSPVKIHLFQLWKQTLNKFKQHIMIGNLLGTVSLFSLFNQRSCCINEVIKFMAVLQISQFRSSPTHSLPCYYTLKFWLNFLMIFFASSKDSLSLPPTPERMEILLSSNGYRCQKVSIYLRCSAHVIDESSVKGIENIEVGIKCSA